MKYIPVIVAALLFSLSAMAQTPKKPGKPEPVTVVTHFLNLPIEFLPGVDEWQKKSNLPDGADTRKSLIESQDIVRGYLKAKAPAENLTTKVLFFEDKDKRPYLAVQTMKCGAECESILRVYRKDSSEWSDVTAQAVPQLDKKMVLKTVKDAYKQKFTDTYKFDKRGYEQDEVFSRAILMDIQDDRTVLVKDQYLPLPLFQLTWNTRGAFDDKSLK